MSKRLLNLAWVFLFCLIVPSVWAQSPSASGTPPAEAEANAAASEEGSSAAEPSATGDVTAEEPSAAATSASEPAASRPPAAAPPAAAPARPPEPEIDGATYVVRLRDLEQRIDELKEQIRRSHTRLSLLSDTILSGGVGGARAEIKFVNKMSDAFRVTRLLVVLDGAVQYNKQDDTGALASQDEIPIFSGSIPPGDHTVQVLVKLRGHGYGVFSYLRGYQFEVKSSESFTVGAGKTMELNAVVFEKGGVTTPIEQRPAVRYESSQRTGVRGAAASGSGQTKAGASGSVSVGAGGK